MTDFIADAVNLKLNYSNEVIASVLNINNDGLLKEMNIYQDPEFYEIWRCDGAGSNFDIFSSVFFLLARVEEYRDYERDEHGRFKLSNSLMYKRGLIELPLVDMWVNQLHECISQFYKENIDLNNTYRFLPTVDIDHIYAYAGKPLGIHLGSLFRDIVQFNFDRIKDRFAAEDPYDRFEYFISSFEHHGIESMFFVMCSPRSAYDKMIAHTHKAYQEKVRYLSSNSEVGIHPSYISASRVEYISPEKQNLENCIAKSIDKSRQHYLKMSLPQTYRALINCGINEDYSMAFHEHIGFRAGTSKPFYWYDLEKDSVSDLKLIPFQVMDITLRKYMDLDADQAWLKVRSLIDRIRSVGGAFVLLWHNSSFYDNEGWFGYEDLFERILAYAK